MLRPHLFIARKHLVSKCLQANSLFVLSEFLLFYIAPMNGTTVCPSDQSPGLSSCSLFLLKLKLSSVEGLPVYLILLCLFVCT